MTYTGGPLNLLNGKTGVSAPHKSVPVMKLLKVHSPKSKEELVELIRDHYETDCKCGVKSQGTVEDFGRNLYNNQKGFWGEIRFTLKECIQWEYDLFVVQTLKGGFMEKKAMKKLGQLIDQYEFSEAEGYLDEEMRIDLLIATNNKVIAGIQVKPLTFKKMRGEVLTFQNKATNNWENPVFYLYYDEFEKFVNIDELKKNILKL